VPPEELKATLSEMVKRINENTARIRRLEGRVEKVDTMIGSLRETFLSYADELKVGLERIDDKLSSVAKRLDTIEEEIARITGRMGRMATKAELGKLERFIDLFSPLKTKFVTREELERVLRKIKT
jgi:chromosome segregation ATPase